MVDKLNHNKLDLKEAWYSKVRVVDAKTDIGSMFYLVDENYNFILLIVSNLLFYKNYSLI